jgi:lipoyl(octanoyl) transferase
MNNPKLLVRDLGRQAYEVAWRKMREYTESRDADSVDQLWWVEHPPVFTLGVGGKEHHVLDAHGVPLVRSNRGGQVTYHGPGQIVMYVLLDMRRLKLSIRQLVSQLEDTVIALLSRHGVAAESRRDAPGVYVNGCKVAAIGLRISRGCSYHGLALNVDMDLEPFQWINPCGYEGLRATQLRDLGIKDSPQSLHAQLAAIFSDKMGYAIATSEPD